MPPLGPSGQPGGATFTRKDMEAAAGGTPVSYTHLDVYKRQGYGCVCRPWPAAGRKLAKPLIRLGLLCFGSVVGNRLHHQISFFVFWCTPRMEVATEEANSASVWPS